MGKRLLLTYGNKYICKILRARSCTRVDVPNDDPLAELGSVPLVGRLATICLEPEEPPGMRRVDLVKPVLDHSHHPGVFWIIDRHAQCLPSVIAR